MVLCHTLRRDPRFEPENDPQAANCAISFDRRHCKSRDSSQANPDSAAGRRPAATVPACRASNHTVVYLHWRRLSGTRVSESSIFMALPEPGKVKFY
jgi:hypothetical protein